MRATAIALLLVVLILMAAVAYVAYYRGMVKGEKSARRQDRIDLLTRIEAHGVLGDGSREDEVFATLKQMLLDDQRRAEGGGWFGPRDR